MSLRTDEALIYNKIDIAPLLRATQQFENFRRHLETEQQKAGAIQAFKYTFELIWKVLKRVLAEQGVQVASPRETFRQAAKNNLINDVGSWFEFLEKRNLTVHTYNEKTADLVVAIFDDFSDHLGMAIDRIKGLR